MAQLSREEVARRLQVYYRARFSGGWLWADYDEQKRAYYIQGNGLDPHGSMRDRHPSGWSMLHYEKPSKARKRVTNKTDNQLRTEGLQKAAETKAEADRVTAQQAA